MNRLWIAGLCLIAVLSAESAAGLRWTAPAGWKNEGSRPMRAATYSIAAEPGDRDPGECVVYFFGAGQGGGVEANLERWKGQFRGPGGKPAEAQIAKRTIKGLAATTIDISGEYSGMGGPMAAEKTSKQGYRMLGAIVEGPGGNLFVKFTGPVKTVTAQKRNFEQLLSSFEKEGK